MKIGIIGYGFVGKAVAAAYDEVLINDPLYQDSTSIETMKESCDAIFVCVPTPPSESGECDSSILESTIQKLTGYHGIIICKSTATPTVYQQIEQNNQLKIAHVPEFLTASNAVSDYLTPVKMVIGCRQDLQADVFNIIKTDKINFDDKLVEYCSIAEASMYKYMANTMLAIKVVLNNEYYDLCQSLNLDWNNIVSIAKADPRLGNTHWQVPGPDGSRGFGGACFPKDTNALAKLASNHGVTLSVLESALLKNKKYRD